MRYRVKVVGQAWQWWESAAAAKSPWIVPLYRYLTKLGQNKVKVDLEIGQGLHIYLFDSKVLILDPAG